MQLRLDEMAEVCGDFKFLIAKPEIARFAIVTEYMGPLSTSPCGASPFKQLEEAKQNENILQATISQEEEKVNVKPCLSGFSPEFIKGELLSIPGKE